MNVDELVQYIVYFDLPDRPDMYVVSRFNGANSLGFSLGRIIAAHKRREAAILVIPSTHVKADVPVEAPIVEVYIDKRVAP